MNRVHINLSIEGEEDSPLVMKWSLMCALEAQDRIRYINYRNDKPSKGLTTSGIFDDDIEVSRVRI